MKYEKLAIFMTFISLWLINFVSKEHQIAISFALVLSIGLLHGSNDYTIISRFQALNKKGDGILFLGGYILVVLFNAILFYKIPSLALFVFIVLSGFHFGEQHLIDKVKIPNKVLGYVLNLVYGLLIFFILFWTNLEETIQVIKDITSIELSNQVFLFGLLFCGITSLLLLLYFKIQNLMRSEVFLFEVFLLFIVAIIFKLSTLVWGFAIYFIFWHSIPSILEQMKFLYGTISWKHFFQYFKSALIVWLISLGSVLLLLWWAKTNQDLVLAMFFAFLGAITFAHSLLMSFMFLKQKKDI